MNIIHSLSTALLIWLISITFAAAQSQPSSNNNQPSAGLVGPFLLPRLLPGTAPAPPPPEVIIPLGGGGPIAALLAFAAGMAVEAGVATGEVSLGLDFSLLPGEVTAGMFGSNPQSPNPVPAPGRESVRIIPKTRPNPRPDQQHVMCRPQPTDQYGNPLPTYFDPASPQHPATGAVLDVQVIAIPGQKCDPFYSIYTHNDWIRMLRDHLSLGNPNEIVPTCPQRWQTMEGGSPVASGPCEPVRREFYTNQQFQYAQPNNPLGTASIYAAMLTIINAWTYFPGTLPAEIPAVGIQGSPFVVASDFLNKIILMEKTGGCIMSFAEYIKCDCAQDIPGSTTGGGSGTGTTPPAPGSGPAGPGKGIELFPGLFGPNPTGSTERSCSAIKIPPNTQNPAEICAAANSGCAAGNLCVPVGDHCECRPPNTGGSVPDTGGGD